MSRGKAVCAAFEAGGMGGGMEDVGFLGGLLRGLRDGGSVSLVGGVGSTMIFFASRFSLRLNAGWVGDMGVLPSDSGVEGRDFESRGSAVGICILAVGLATCARVGAFDILRGCK